MNDNPESLEEFFHQAIQLPLQDQISFIRNACGHDETMRRELEGLLDSHQNNESDDFILDRPKPYDSGEAEVARIAESEGDMIGRYRLLELIGEGGMGRVYMAVQTEGVRRRVALKIIKLGMDTRQIIARFEAERQALALFDHPNITRVLDAGSTTAGRPYFVMELVRGTCITDYVQAYQLSLPDRLGLFVDVCRAVRHAHLKGVIHRDLKPSNILVTQFDGVPVPKVIDFGIAKAIGQQRLTDKTLFTRYAAMVGTPQYMSPEQAEMTGLDIDTRADVYSLGVILYELITGSTPLDANQLRQLNPLALFETLRDANIETPSARVLKTQQSSNDSKGATQSGTAEASTSPERIKGDLDWIVMKSLSRDRRQRYETASDLAADVERYLNGDPVEAAPPSKFYLLKAFFRKFRSVALIVLTFGTLLLLTTITCAILAVSNYKQSTKLQTTVTELQTLKRQKQYESAVSLALIRFDMEVMKEQTKSMIPIEFQKFQLQSKNSSEMDREAGELFGDGEIGDAFGTIVSSPTVPPFERNELLLKFEQAELIEPALQHIRKAMEKQERFSQHMDLSFSQTELSNSGEMFVGSSEIDLNDLESKGSVIVHESQVVRMPAEMEASLADSRKLIIKSKHRFFRILVKEYQNEFGNDDPRVAQSLNLLAAYLIEGESFEEAKSKLKSAIQLAEAEDKLVAEKLLAIANQRGQ